MTDEADRVDSKAQQSTIVRKRGGEPPAPKSDTVSGEVPGATPDQSLDLVMKADHRRTATAESDQARQTFGYLITGMGLLVIVLALIAGVGMVQYSFAFVKELTFSESEAFKAHSHPEILQAVLLSRAFIVVSALAFGGALVRGGTRLFRPLWMEIELAELNQVSNHETDGEQTLTGAIQDLVSALAAALRPKS